MSISTYGPLFQPGAKITPAIRRAATRTSDYALDALKSRTPVRSGEMIGAWKVKPEAYGVRITNSAPHAIYVEMGTKSMKARRPVARAMPDIQNHFRFTLAQEIGKSLSGKLVGSVSVPQRASSPKDPKAYSALTNSDRQYNKGLRPGVGGRPPRTIDLKDVRSAQRALKRLGSGKGFG